MFEEILSGMGTAIVIAVGLGIVWFFARAIARAAGGGRAESLREFRAVHWIAIALVVAVSLFASNLVPHLAGLGRSGELAGWVDSYVVYTTPLDFWWPAFIAVAGGLLVVSRRMGVRLSVALAVLVLAEDVGWWGLAGGTPRSLLLLSAQRWLPDTAMNLALMLAALWLGALVFSIATGEFERKAA